MLVPLAIVALTSFGSSCGWKPGSLTEIRVSDKDGVIRVVTDRGELDEVAAAVRGARRIQPRDIRGTTHRLDISGRSGEPVRYGYAAGAGELWKFGIWSREGYRLDPAAVPRVEEVLGISP
jgi:hypothetical protein